MKVRLLGGRRGWLALIGFFLFVEAIVVLLAVVSVSVSSSTLRQDAKEDARRTAGAAQVTLRQRIEPPLAAVEQVATEPALAVALGPDGGGSDADRLGVLKGLVGGGLGFDRAFVTNQSGVVISYWPKTDLIGANLVQEDWFSKAQQANEVEAGKVESSAGAYFGSLTNGSPAVPIFAPIRNPNSGVRLGYVVAVLDLDQIQFFVDSIYQTTSVSVTVIDPSGLFIARASARLQIPNPIDFNLVKQALEGKSTLVEDTRYSPIFSSYSPLPPLGWAVVVDMPAAAPAAAIDRMTSTVIALAIGLSCLLLAGLAFGLVQVQRLQATALVGQQVEVMKRLNEAAYDVHRESGPAVLDRIIETAMLKTGAEFGALAVSEGGTRWRDIYKSAGLVKAPPVRLFEALSERGLAQSRADQAIFVPSIDDLLPPVPDEVRPPFGALLAAPLLAGEDMIGILVVARGPDRGGFEPTAQGLLTELSHHAATATVRARHERDLSSNLETERERFRIAFEEGPIGMLILDTSLHTLRVNEAFAQMVGRDQAELEATSPGDSSFPVIENWDLRSVAARLLKGEVSSVQAEHRCQHAAGNWLWTLVTVSLVRDREGLPVWFLIQLQDVTERRRLLEMRIEGALRESEAKSRFLATMSHELRTPLNAIMGFAQLLGRPTYGDLNERQRRYLDHIEVSSRHLLALISEILDFSRVRSGQVRINPEQVNLRSVVDDLIARSRPDVEAKRLTLVCEVDEKVEVWADPLRLAQVLWNLISNATKFTPAGGTITVSCEKVAEVVKIRVRDTGEGIPHEQQERIFEEFTQIDSSLARERQGTGLGLSISRRLVELMDGSMTVESQLGHGATFIVTLPRSQSVTLAG